MTCKQHCFITKLLSLQRLRSFCLEEYEGKILRLKGKKEKRGKGKRADQRSLDFDGELLFEGCTGDEYGGGKVVGGVV